MSIAGVSIVSEQIVVVLMLYGSGFKAFGLIGFVFCVFDCGYEILSLKLKFGFGVLEIFPVRLVIDAVNDIAVGNLLDSNLFHRFTDSSLASPKRYKAFPNELTGPESVRGNHRRLK